ncbi:MAG: RIP metalloprotease RseP [Muribaculaceae bacterium]|nr:RIP metalloprotease RseP [Muribaculaceae bacterium]
MESTLMKALQLIVALLILVTIHEFGHYFFARVFGIKVNRFYLFFNPWFSILKYRPDKGTLELIGWTDKDGKDRAWKTFKVGKAYPPRPDGKQTWRDTLYGLGWLPLGGYCDIAGMVDETKSSKDLASEPQPWEFRSKAVYKRFLVMVAGVLFNFILAIAIYTGIAIHWGDRVVPFSAMTEGMDFSSEFQEAGFRNGDRLLSLNGSPIDAKDYSVAWNLVQPGAMVEVLRDGRDTVGIVITDRLLSSIVEKGKDYMPMSIRIPVVIANLMPGDPAASAGMEKADRIVKVGNDTTPTITEFMPALAAHKGETLPFVIIRDGKESTLYVNINDGGKIGIQMLSPSEIFEIEEVHYSWLSAIPRGWEIGTDRLATYVSSLKLVFSKEGAQSVGGFGTLGSLFPDKWDWYSFWQITAFLSVILAFMNIIPIPGLDGGYILFLLIELITRRKPSDKVLEYANMIGMAFIFLLLIYANGNDIYRLLIK